MKSVQYLLTLLLGLFAFQVQAQQLTQTIRGRVTENETLQPIAGALVELISAEGTPKTQTDTAGNFRFDKVAIGRHMLRITAGGFKEGFISDIILNSAREVVLNISLEADFVKIKTAEVVVKRNNPAATNNDLVLVSGRNFTIDQTNRYAGSLGDPSRMVANFAGVSSVGSQRNDIIIRGNSPMGLLWRLDGADIPNPNHYASQGATGGPVSILNNNTLANSDFLTSAFPAEYGNATSGVFDLKMRNGNDQKRQWMGQVGFNGFEAGAEGPFARKNGGSYIINYRYSTLAFMSTLGFKLTYGGVPYYQDLSFKVNLPHTKTGEWALIGVGGLSSISILDKNRDTTDMSYGSAYRNNIINGSNMGVLILSNVNYLGKRGYWKNVLNLNAQKRFTRVDSVTNTDETPWKYAEQALNTRAQWHSFVNFKLSNRVAMRSGFFVNQLGSDLRDSFRNGETVRTLRNYQGNNFLGQAYTQWKLQAAKNVVVTPGLYYQYWAANKQSRVEPRLGIKWNTGKKSSIFGGVGMHSSTQPLEVYHARVWDSVLLKYRQPNKDLGFTKSNHAALGFELLPFRSLRFRVETYYQILNGVPVETTSKNNFSLLNWGADFTGLPVLDTLLNKGKGKNYGVEFTLEKFFSNNYYFLVTTSIFKSQYATTDNQWRSTAWDGNYIVNALAGYDLKLGKNKNSIVSFNVKGTIAGGRRYTPVNVAETIKNGNLVQYDYAHAFESKFDDYFRLDLRIGYKRNGKHVTQEWAVDLQNVTNHKNPLTMSWDFNAKKVRTEYQQGFYPMMMYRIYF